MSVQSTDSAHQRRATPLERAGQRVFMEAGARVVVQPRLRHIDVDVSA